MSPGVVGAVGAALGVVLLVAVLQGVEPMVSDLRVRRRGRTGPRPAVVGPGAVLAGATWNRLRRVLGEGDRRRRRRADRELAPLLDQVTRHLRAGASLSGAVVGAATSSADPSTGRLATDVDAGMPLAVAVDRWQVAEATPARDLAAAALILASDAGGAVAVVLDGVTDTLRDRVALEREVAALSSQARASAAVLVVAPVAFAVLAALADPRVAQVLLGQPLGWACLAAGAVLDGVGALWMRHLVGGTR